MKTRKIENEIKLINPQSTSIPIKPRKKRVTKSGMVNIDDVIVSAGEKFENWIPITRKKLLEREINIITRRIEQIKLLINRVVSSSETIKFLNKNVVIMYINNNINVNNLFRNKKCFKYLQDRLQKWKGVRCLKKNILYNEYFRKCKSWFDHQKLPVIGKEFWLPLFYTINDFCGVIAENIHSKYSDEHNMFRNYLNVQFQIELLNTTFKIPNTKSLSLISMGIYHCNSFVEFFLNQKFKRNILSKVIKQKIMNKLNKENKKLLQKYNYLISFNNNNNNNNNNYSPPINNNNNNNTQIYNNYSPSISSHNSHSSSHSHNTHQILPPSLINLPPINNNNNNNNVYGPSHSQSQYVQASRHHPFQMNNYNISSNISQNQIQNQEFEPYLDFCGVIVQYE